LKVKVASRFCGIKGISTTNTQPNQNIQGTDIRQILNLQTFRDSE
jgi:hypothetical protein